MNEVWQISWCEIDLQSSCHTGFSLDRLVYFVIWQLEEDSQLPCVNLRSLQLAPTCSLWSGRSLAASESGFSGKRGCGGTIG